MTPASQTLAFIRTLAAIAYFLGALVLFLLALWLVVLIVHFEWVVDIIGALIAWTGLQMVRQGCEELRQNEAQRAAEQKQDERA